MPLSLGMKDTDIILPHEIDDDIFANMEKFVNKKQVPALKPLLAMSFDRSMGAIIRDSIQYIRSWVEDEKLFIEVGLKRQGQYTYWLNCCATKTKSRILTTPSPLGSGADFPRLLVT